MKENGTNQVRGLKIFALMLSNKVIPLGVTGSKAEADAWRKSAPIDRYWLEYEMGDDLFGFLQTRRKDVEGRLHRLQMVIQGGNKKYEEELRQAFEETYPELDLGQLLDESNPNPFEVNQWQNL